jgi:hypothetical protein
VFSQFCCRRRRKNSLPVALDRYSEQSHAQNQSVTDVRCARQRWNAHVYRDTGCAACSSGRSCADGNYFERARGEHGARANPLPADNNPSATSGFTWRAVRERDWQCITHSLSFGRGHAFTATLYVGLIFPSGLVAMARTPPIPLCHGARPETLAQISSWPWLRSRSQSLRRRPPGKDPSAEAPLIQQDARGTFASKTVQIYQASYLNRCLRRLLAPQNSFKYLQLSHAAVRPPTSALTVL